MIMMICDDDYDCYVMKYLYDVMWRWLWLLYAEIYMLNIIVELYEIMLLNVINELPA
jgi:hypothetical protein